MRLDNRRGLSARTRRAPPSPPRASLFLAGDGVDYLRDETMAAANGVRTGSIREHYSTFADAGGRLYASAISSKARGIDEAAATGIPVKFAKPDQLVELNLGADQVVTY